MTNAFAGVGLFYYNFQGMTLAADEVKKGNVQWITPLLAPDQEAVQRNRLLYDEWRKSIACPFYAWIVCDSPTVDIARAEWLCGRYKVDGIVWNAEKSYESTGYWKADVLCKGIVASSVLAPLPHMLSMPSTPAERYHMDYRAFEKAGFTFGPQAYWKDPTIQGVDATPRNLYQSLYLPEQIHVGWNYRIQPKGEQPRWALCEAEGQLNNVHFITMRDLQTKKRYRINVIVKFEGTFKYLVCPRLDRRMYPHGSALSAPTVGNLLGFAPKSRIYPTVGIYENCMPTEAELIAEMVKVTNLTGGSIYLGEIALPQMPKSVQIVHEAIS